MNNIRMNNIQKRFALFLGGCIPARVALTLFAKYMPHKYLPILGSATFIIALGFLYLYFTGQRKTGRETFGAPIWWSNFRIIHGFMYLFFSINAFNKNPNAYLFLLYDTLFGLLIFILHHSGYL
jgi:hypothetical protein